MDLVWSSYLHKGHWKMLLGRQFSHFSMKLLQGGTNELTQDGFDWIALSSLMFSSSKRSEKRSCSEVRNVICVPFSEISLYYSVVMKCCPILNHRTALHMWDVLPLNVPKGLMVSSRFQGQKVPIWTFVIFGHLKNVTCSSVYLVNFNIWWPYMIK